MGSLENVESPSHVSLREFDQGLLSLGRDLNAFPSNDFTQPVRDLGFLERSKPEPSASRLNSRNDFAHIVANDAEAHILGVLFNDCFIAR